jgi:16S rRNA (guanine966-N2)-methyltransferase
VRIIAGRLGGRLFASPGTHKTHPMSDKVRGALFNVLGDIDNLEVLDAFAGSGALGFEAVSRGAKHVLAIDSDKKAQSVIEQNVRELGLSRKVRLIKASANAWLGTTEDAFDLVLLDPPYDDLQPKLVTRLAERTNIGGIVVLSQPPEAKPELPDDFSQLATKDYGDAQLFFFRRDK